MSVEIKMQRKEGAEADFTEWNLEEGIEALKPFINQMLNNALSVVFSESGANARLSVDVWHSPAEDLQIECEIEIAEYEAYASAKVSLRELITDAADCVDEAGDRQKMADALRALADSIAPNAVLRGEPLAASPLENTVMHGG